MDDLRAESGANGVSAVCAIQTSTFYGFDNRYVRDTARGEGGWLAGVCTLDPDDPASPGLLARHTREDGIRGMRSIPAADGTLDHPGVRRLWRTAADLGLVVNLLIGPDHAEEADELLRAFPDLRVVLDHCLNLRAGPGAAATVDAVRRLAGHPNLHAKLTFVPTGSATGYPCADMHAACLAVVDAFGADRCVWGSDFPCELWAPRVSYAEHLRIFTHELGLDEPTRAAILGGTAIRLWFPELAAALPA